MTAAEAAMGRHLFPRIACVTAALALGGAGWINPPASAPPAQGPAAVQQAPTPATTQAAPVEVSGWSLGGGRLTLLLHGNMAAVDQLRSDGKLSVEVHWTHQGAGGAPDLVTELPVGKPQLASVLAGEVEKQGYFSWHSWALKRDLGPGPWSVSVTLPDGTPVPCAPQGQPCQLSLNPG
jgi:hypothetical protein